MVLRNAIAMEEHHAEVVLGIDLTVRGKRGP
jgi:hypothetical protein